VISATSRSSCPDATLAELRDALPTRAALTTPWRTIGRLGFTLKKRYTPTSNAGLMSARAGTRIVGVYE
jgi:hypothetical protein